MMIKGLFYLAVIKSNKNPFSCQRSVESNKRPCVQTAEAKLVSEFSQVVRQQMPVNLNELKQSSKEEWAKILP